MKLGDILLNQPQYGYTASAKNKYVGPKFLRITDIQGHTVNWDNVPYCEISESDKEKYLLEVGDLVFARTGATTGMNYFVEKKPPQDTIFASYLIRLRADRRKCDSGYLRYFFRSHLYWGQVKGFLSGSAQPGINASLLSELKLSIPESVDEQKRIAAILSAFDDKIKLNNKISRTLEEMTAAIFKEWFVKFKFPGHEKIKMVDSELGKIPKGWEVKKLEDVLSLEYGKSLTSINRKNGDVPVYASSGLVGYHNEKLVDGPGIIVGRAGIPGSVYWSQTDFHCVDSTFYVKSDISKYFLYYLLKYQNLESLISGSAVPGINRNLIYLNKIILPNPEIIEKFEQIMIPLFDKIYKNKLENQKLASLRDLLLPKLMNGEIRVRINLKNYGFKKF